MSSERLTVSLIIPTYNRAAMIQETIQNVFDQTRVPDEIIVVDDGSTDDTVEVLKSYGDNIIVMAEPHRGGAGGAARNAGMTRARGDLITYLDSDDLLPANSVEIRASFLERHKEKNIVYGNTIVIDGEGKQISHYGVYQPGKHPSGMIFPQMACRNFIPVHAVMFRRSCWDTVQPFDIGLAPVEDYGFWLEMTTQYEFDYLNETVAYYRHHENMTLTPENRTRSLKQVIKAQRRVFEMPAFQLLSTSEKSMVYGWHGLRHAGLGHGHELIREFRQAIQQAPLQPHNYFQFLRAVRIWFLNRGRL